MGKDGRIEAHKVILSAGSTFFQKILKENPHSKPLIYLKGVKISELNSVLRFIYCGEASIATANLNPFLALAEELEVKGLMDKDKDRVNNSGDQPPLPPTPPSDPAQSAAHLRHQPTPPSSDLFNNNSDESMKLEPQFEPPEGTVEVKGELQQTATVGVNQYDGYNQYEDYDQDQDNDQGYNLNQEYCRTQNWEAEEIQLEEKAVEGQCWRLTWTNIWCMYPGLHEKENSGASSVGRFQPIGLPPFTI